MWFVAVTYKKYDSDVTIADITISREGWSAILGSSERGVDDTGPNTDSSYVSTSHSIH